MKSISINQQPFLLVVALTIWLLSHSTWAATVWQLDIQGAIGPATADYVVRGLADAHTANAELVILRIDTPGGLDKSMRFIIKHILASPTPVVSYVAPAGSRAASAGTYILYASHIAVMAPATNLGAATPVQIQPPTPSIADKDPNNEGAKSTAPSSAMERKIINDAVAYIEGLASLRGRNAEFAIKAVREGASLSAQQALEENVIDLIAENMESLLEQLHGWSISMSDGDRVVQTADALVMRYEADWRNQFLSVITDPNVAYILMLIGIYGLLFEFSNPGMGGPGIIGAICILLALYAFQVLPVSYAGVALILLGIALIAAEAMIPSVGVLGIGGVVAFVVGSIILMDTELPAYQIALPLILSVGVASTVFLLVVLRLLTRSRKRAVVTGVRSFIGQIATVENIDNGQIWVRFEGERWQARSTDALQVNDAVFVEAVNGLQLTVRKAGG